MTWSCDGLVELPVPFFARDATEVAPDLLYKLVRIESAAGPVVARILEVEAYTQDDPASHSFRGPTPRSATMFGPPGRWYVYLIYGMHHCINIVTGAEGDGQAVLVRSAVVPEVPLRRTDGPGKLARTLGLDRSNDGARAEVYDDGIAVAVPTVTPRIGITKAIDWPRRWLVPWPPPPLASPAPQASPAPLASPSRSPM